MFECEHESVDEFASLAKTFEATRGYAYDAPELCWNAFDTVLSLADVEEAVSEFVVEP